MADTFTTHARFRKIEHLGQNDLWGGEFNGTLDLIEEMFWGIEPITISGNYTLAAIGDDASSETRHLAYVLSGAPGAAFDFVVPTGLIKPLIVYNGTDGLCTVKYAASAGFAVRVGTIALLFANATDVAEVGGEDENNAPDVPLLDWLTELAYVPLSEEAPFVSGGGIAHAWKTAELTADHPTNAFANIVLAGDSTGSCRHKIELTKNITGWNGLSIVDGQAVPFMLRLKQDAIGGRTVAWFPFRFAGGVAPVVTPTANAVDIAQGIAIRDGGSTIPYVTKYLANVS